MPREEWYHVSLSGVGEMEKYVRLMCLREPRITFAQSLGHLGASVGKGHLHSSEALANSALAVLDTVAIEMWSQAPLRVLSRGVWPALSMV